MCPVCDLLDLPALSCYLCTQSPASAPSIHSPISASQSNSALLPLLLLHCTFPPLSPRQGEAAPASSNPRPAHRQPTNQTTPAPDARLQMASGALGEASPAPPPLGAAERPLGRCGGAAVAIQPRPSMHPLHQTLKSLQKVFISTLHWPVLLPACCTTRMRTLADFWKVSSLN